MAKVGPIVAFFGWCTPQSLDECKEWIRGNGWTSDDVRIMKTDEQDGYIVLAKRRLW